MKNKIAITFILCFLLGYIGCKKAETAISAPPIIQTDDESYYKFSHYTAEDLSNYLTDDKGDKKKKCNNCHATK